MGLEKRDHSNEKRDEGTSGLPDIYAFHDYRAFIQAWADSQTTFSVRSLSMSAGFNESYLALVIRGHRNLTESAQEKLLSVLQLGKSESSFFKLLVQLADSQTKEEKLQAISSMHRFKKYREATQVSAESYKYLSHWYYVAIREMVSLPGFKLEPKWIQKKLNHKVSLKEIQGAIRFLIQNEYIRLSPDGKIVNNQPALDCSGGIYKLALGEFHEQMFQLASQVSETTPRDLRMIDANTFPVSNDDIPEIKEILTSAIDEVVALMKRKSKDSKKEMVYHIAFTGFPLTKKDSSK